MQQSDFRLPAADGTALYVRSFLPDQTPRAIVQIAHGLAEHSARYARFAEALTAHGYAAYANDHRGHGHTASAPEELGHFADHDGWNKVVSDQVELLREIKSRHPRAPVFLMGHSMGSFIVRGAAQQVGSELAGLILSGTGHDSVIATQAVHVMVVAERARVGARGTSALIRKLTFEKFNETIPDPRTSCDWLSRDQTEVDKYIADPLCGFECTTQLWCDLFHGMAEVFSDSCTAQLPKDLPVYVLAGERDPLNEGLEAIKKLHQAFERAGLTRVTLRVYEGARHELLNETNRADVTHDLIAWLDEQLAQHN